MQNGKHHKWGRREIHQLPEHACPCLNPPIITHGLPTSHCHLHLLGCTLSSALSPQLLSSLSHSQTQSQVCLQIQCSRDYHDPVATLQGHTQATMRQTSLDGTIKRHWSKGKLKGGCYGTCSQATAWDACIRIGVLPQTLATVLAIQLHSNGSGKDMDDDPHIWVPAPQFCTPNQ